MRPKLPSKTHASNFKITASWVNSVVENLTELWNHVKGDGKTIRVSDTGTVSFIGTVGSGDGGGGYPVRSFIIYELTKKPEIQPDNQMSQWIYKGFCFDLWDHDGAIPDFPHDYLLIPNWIGAELPKACYMSTFFCARCEHPIKHPEGQTDEKGNVLMVTPYMLLDYWMFNGGIFLPEESES